MIEVLILLRTPPTLICFFEVFELEDLKFQRVEGRPDLVPGPSVLLLVLVCACVCMAVCVLLMHRRFASLLTEQGGEPCDLLLPLEFNTTVLSRLSHLVLFSVGVNWAWAGLSPLWASMFSEGMIALQGMLWGGQVLGT